MKSFYFEQLRCIIDVVVTIIETLNVSTEKLFDTSTSQLILAVPYSVCIILLFLYPKVS